MQKRLGKFEIDDSCLLLKWKRLTVGLQIRLGKL